MVKADEEIIECYHRRIRRLDVIGRVIMPALGVIVIGSYLIDTVNHDLSSFVRKYLLSEAWSFAIFIILFAPAFIVGLISCRCPVCDSFTTGKREKANYCPSCKIKFDIDKFREKARKKSLGEPHIRMSR